jgi:hypothetical protein
VNDYASVETKNTAEVFIREEIETKESAVKKKIIGMLERVNKGERDVFF